MTKHPGAESGGNTGPTPELIDRVVTSILSLPMIRHLGPSRLPSREAVAELVLLVRELVFPGFFGRRDLTEANLRDHVAELLARVRAHAAEQIASVERYMAEQQERTDRGGPEDTRSALASHRPRRITRDARELADRFVEQIPEIRRLLALDVQAAYDGDPAAEHPDETIFCYPGVEAIFSHRIAHALYTMGVPLLPRIIQEMSHSRTGIDIHPGARIGEKFFIDHGGGVVIGETTVIGNQVRIYQGVTLGAKSLDRDERGRVARTGRQRHPTIGDRVTIYAGAVILGGDTVIGDDCVISGGVFLTQSVPAGHMVRNKPPELVMRGRDGGKGLGTGG